MKKKNNSISLFVVAVVVISTNSWLDIMKWYSFTRFYALFTQMCHCYAKWWLKWFLFYAHLARWLLQLRLHLSPWATLWLHERQNHIFLKQQKKLRWMNEWMDQLKWTDVEEWAIDFYENSAWTFLLVESLPMITSNWQHVYAFEMLEHDFKTKAKHINHNGLPIHLLPCSMHCSNSLEFTSINIAFAFN